MLKSFEHIHYLLYIRLKPTNLMPTGFETKTLFDGEKDPMPPLKPPGDKPSRGEGESEEKKPKKEKKPPKAKTPEQEGKNVPWQLS